MYSRTALQGYLQDDAPTLSTFLTSDMSITAARIFSLNSSLLKKFTGEIDIEACDASALSKFLECNRRCASFKLDPQRLYDDILIGEVKASLIDSVGNGPTHALDMWSFSDYLGVGPGANVDVKSYNFYTKVYDSTLTHTEPHLLRMYRTIISRHPVKYNAERRRYNTHGARVVAGSKLSFVPKTSAISRTICTEPTLNMMFQKALGELICASLRRQFNIDLSSQPDINRRMAKLGSLDGRFATIDLESASDSISMSLCEAILPRPLWSWLKLFRSPVTTLPGGQQVKLDMISSMGNGFTFPLQTLIFATIVASCYRLKGLTPFDGRSVERNFSVFGDDIIVRKDCYEFVVHALELFGFRVNKEKSFNTGHFRESCGEDYYRGHNVRGVYLHRLETKADVYSAINRLVRWSAKSGVLLHSLVGALRRKVKYLPIPPCDGDAEGLKVPLSMALGSITYDKNLQSYKYKALQARPFVIDLPQPVNEYADVGIDHGLYYNKKLIHKTRWANSRNRLDYNPDGLMDSFVGGFIRDGQILLRSTERGPAQIVTRVSSSWDYLSRSDHAKHGNFGSWEAASLELLSL
jgi:hypothetical protein